MNRESFSEAFARDVDAGLSARPKKLSSRYFYDKEGDRLFTEIMRLPEYYLTRCEYSIFEQQAGNIISSLGRHRSLQLVELGAGDGTKTRLLINALLKADVNFSYHPVDISAHALEELSSALSAEYPALEVLPVRAEYHQAVLHLPEGEHTRLVLFLGSNIGNLQGNEQQEFLQELYSHLRPGDHLLTGFDLVKDPHIILAAYNDAAGITRDFNLNLLRRINRELRADFNPENFRHFPLYDPVAFAARSYLVSLVDQDVHIGALNRTFHFHKAEAIHTETSRKYTRAMIAELARLAGFIPVKEFTDEKAYFTDALWKK